MSEGRHSWQEELRKRSSSGKAQGISKHSEGQIHGEKCLRSDWER